jgi:ABC-2 type transport system ATP-binding protein
VADGTAEDLQRRMPYHNAVAIRIGADRAEVVIGALSGLNQIAKVERLDAVNGHIQLRALPRNGASIAGDVAALLRERSISVEEMFVERGKLDDVFRQITSSDEGAGHA